MEHLLPTRRDKSIMSVSQSPQSRFLLGMRVDGTSYQKATAQVMEWARQGESRYVCVANVHMVMEAYDRVAFRKAVNQADLVTPDGMPLVWSLRQLGLSTQQRVYGPDLTLWLCEAAAAHGIPIGLYGARQDTLDILCGNLRQRFDGLDIAYAYSPPFRPLSLEEQDDVRAQIHQSGAKILLVGLGCPKQEWWMSEQVGRLQAVMVGVGAAFDFHAGRVPQAPSYLQEAGLEWLFRLTKEPKRLWKRYLKHNPRFVALMGAQLAGLDHFFSPGSASKTE